MSLYGRASSRSTRTTCGGYLYVDAMTFSQTQKAGTLVHLEDKAGNEILTFAPTKNFQNVVISSPKLKKGSYNLYTGGTSTGSAKDGLYTDGKYSGGTVFVEK